MRKNVLIIALMLTMTISAFSQQRNCGTMEHLEWLQQQNPNLKDRMREIETFTQQWIATHPEEERIVVTIPVVVHVVYNTSAQNISDAQVQAQIAQLNADFARSNSDAGNTPSVWQSTAANCEVQFCLAQRDPNGNATNGIIHKSTSTTSFSQNNNVKFNSSGGSDAWPSSSYLNIWSCNLGGGLLGYAQFPGGSSSTDGVVVLYSSIGSLTSPGTASPYNLGRTLTHEVGHWLNLYHIWGDDGSSCSGTDNVSDTPNQAAENYGCPAFPKTDACASGNGVMFMNYMDYTDDACMNMYTSGQKSRMQALFVSGGSRFALTSSLGCTPPGGGTCGTSTGLNATSVTSSSATLNWGSVSGAISYNVQYRVVGSGTWTSTTATTTSKAISFLTASTQYEFQVQAVCSGSSSVFSSSGTFTTLASGGGTYCASNGNSQAYEYIDFVSLGTISRTSGAEAGGYYNGSATSTNVNKGSSYTITTSAGFTGSTYSEYWAVFCDWNGDQDFTDAGETAVSFTSSGSGNNTASISVPSTATTGTTRMRVSMKYGAAPTSCESFAEGEAEDYSLNIQAGGGGGCAESHESNNTTGTAAAISVGIDILSQISTSTDVDWFSFANTSTNKNIKVTLTTLPGDYDIRLYNPSGTNVKTSQNGGTSSETIIYNTSTVGTYKLKIYGYAGAYSSSQCYTLKVLTQASPFRYAFGEEPLISNKSDINIFPNPVYDNMTVQFNSDVKGDAVLNVYNLLGQNVYHDLLLAVEGENNFSVEVSSLMTGSYIIEVVNNGESLRKEFIVTK